ncbi:MAG: DUF1800 family protein [Bacteroidota bacterium]
MKNTTFCLFLLFFLNGLFAQNYTDYIGAGHNEGLVITTSHNQSADMTGNKSADGFPVTDVELLADASRFLAQASLGYDYEMIQMTAAMGYEAWLDEQFTLPQQSITEQMLVIASYYADPGEEGIPTASMREFRSAWWENSMKNSDLLRHKINYIFSQIFVVSAFGSDLFEDIGYLSSSYYDMLGQNTFGNYRKLLNDVSRHVSMGLYLNHLNNPKSNPAQNIHPDENYAREVMQLFSIGLYELNPDGSRKLDGNGKFIPTYNNDDIREFAKIFTGFGDGHPESLWGEPFGEHDIALSANTPMKMYEEWHESGPKVLLNGQTVPAGQTGLQDFNDAMDNLHNHPNIGPFIGKALIQFLVSANPSPAYIGRVTNSFNNNGAGVRGDLQAVIKAILLDPEARDCNALANPTAGKLREPIVRYSHVLQAFHAYRPIFTTDMENWYSATGQVPMYSSSVFNFYQPEFQPNGPVANQGLFAPVFQIHNSSTSVGFINEVDNWTFSNEPMIFLDDAGADTLLDLSTELAIADSPTELVDHLDLLLAAGQLSTHAKTTIIQAVSQLSAPEDRVRMAVYLILISPDFAFLK